MTTYLQEIFDTVAEHLMKQYAVSSSNGSCMYRGEDGLMCAIGCLIKDDKYTPDIEKQGVWCPAIQNVLSASGVVVEDIYLLKLLGKLQAIHDKTPVKYWLNDLSIIAVDEGLNTTKLEEAAIKYGRI